MRRIITAGLFIILILCGCGNQEVPPSPVPSSPALAAPPASAAPSSAAPPASKESPESSPDEGRQKPQEMIKQLNQVLAKGKTVAVLQEKNSLSFVQKEQEKNKVYRLDLKTGGIEKTELSCSLTGRCEVQKTEGYVVFYLSGEKVVIMDRSFQFVDELTIKDKILDGMNRNFCVLPKDKKIVYTKERLKNGECYQEVNECDYSGQGKRQICRIEGAMKSVGELNRIGELIVSENEKILYFTGLYFKTKNENETSLPCFGKINRDTGKVTAVQEEKYFGQLMGNKMMFVDGLREKGITPSGYITCLDENGRQEKCSFQRKEESQEVIVSDEGNDYLSYEKMDDERRTKVSGYAFQKNTFQWEKELPHYVSEIWYFEQAEMLLYTYYDDEGNLYLDGEVIEG